MTAPRFEMDPTQGATLSDCGQYRYRLWRLWDEGRRALWIMLNPSTADAEVDDPTIRKCKGFARQWKMGGIEVVNLFAVRTSNPKNILKTPNPLGPGNIETIETMLNMAKRYDWVVVAAWGALNPRLVKYADQILGLCKVHGIEPMCLDVTKHGHPRHPLYIPYTQYPMPLELARERKK